MRRLKRCPNDAIILSNTKRVLLRNQNKVTLEQQSMDNFQTINFIQLNLTRINYGHNQIIKDGVDIVYQLDPLVKSYYR